MCAYVLYLAYLGYFLQSDRRRPGQGRTEKREEVVRGLAEVQAGLPEAEAYMVVRARRALRRRVRH